MARTHVLAGKINKHARILEVPDYKYTVFPTTNVTVTFGMQDAYLDKVADHVNKDTPHNGDE